MFTFSYHTSRCIWWEVTHKIMGYGPLEGEKIALQRVTSGFEILNLFFYFTLLFDVSQYVPFFFFFEIPIFHPTSYNVTPPPSTELWIILPRQSMTEEKSFNARKPLFFSTYSPNSSDWLIKPLIAAERVDRLFQYIYFLNILNIIETKKLKISLFFENLSS